MLPFFCALLMAVSPAVAHSDGASYQYDSLGRLVKVTFSDGSTINYAYDENGNRTSVRVCCSDPAKLTTADAMSDWLVSGLVATSPTALSPASFSNLLLPNSIALSDDEAKLWINTTKDLGSGSTAYKAFAVRASDFGTSSETNCEAGTTLASEGVSTVPVPGSNMIISTVSVSGGGHAFFTASPSGCSSPVNLTAANVFAAVSPDGSKAAFALADGTVALSHSSDDFATVTSTFSISPNPLSITFDAAGTSLWITYASSSVIEQYNLTGSLVQSFDVGSVFPDYEFIRASGSNLIITSGSDAKIFVVDTAAAPALTSTVNLGDIAPRELVLVGSRGYALGLKSADNTYKIVRFTIGSTSFDVLNPGLAAGVAASGLAVNGLETHAYTISGGSPDVLHDYLLPADVIPSGVAYVDGQRVVVSEAEHQYTPSTDTYQFLQSDGSSHFLEVANNDPQPSDTGLLISKTVTDALGVSTVTGLAPTIPTITANIPGYARSGANSDITSLSGLTTPLSLGQGGTGSNLSSATAGALPYINGTGGTNTMPAGDPDSVPVWDGTQWTSQPYGGGSGTELPEDSPHVSGDLGSMPLAVRNDGNIVTTDADGDYSALSVNSKGALAVQDGGNSLTVDGTVGLSAGSNLIGGIKVIDSAGTNAASVSAGGALKVDGSGVTQPISAAALPLPAGASTSAKQPALGTAGSSASDVITVQGISGMNALKVDGSAVTQPVSGSVSVSSLPALAAGSNTIGGVKVIDSAGTNAASVSAGGALKVDGSGVTQPVSGSVGINAGSNLIGGVKLIDAGGTNAAAISAGGVLSIGDVNVKLEDAPSGSGDIGQLVLGVRNDSQAALTNADGDYSGVAVDAAGRVQISDGAGSITVDGTVAATQSGTWTVQPGNTANTTPWLTTINEGGNSAAVTASNALKVDGSAVTQPISASSLPLPAGAATSAKQPTLGTAGSASTDIITVQGISGMTAVAVDGSSVTQPVSISALPALASGANTIGSVKVTDGTNTASVTADGKLQVNATVTAAAQYAEDSAHASGDLGSLSLAVRSDNLAADLTSNDGDYSTIAVNSKGAVAITPTSTMVPATVQLQTNASAAGNGTVLDVTGFSLVTLRMSNTSFISSSGTVAFEGSTDGSNWISLNGTRVSDNVTARSVELPFGSGWQYWRLNVAGIRSLRARITSVSTFAPQLNVYADKFANAAPGDVVSESASVMPNSVKLQDNASANGNGTALNVTGYNTAILRIDTGTGGSTASATINFEASTDDTNWVSLMGTRVEDHTGAASVNIFPASVQHWAFNVAGFRSLRARVSNINFISNLNVYGQPSVDAPQTIALLPQTSAYLYNNASPSGTLTSSSVDVGNQNAVTLGLSVASTTGTVNFEASIDNINWEPISGTRVSDKSRSSSRTFASTTSTEHWMFNFGGFKFFRLRLTSFSSFTTTALVYGSTTSPEQSSLQVANQTKATYTACNPQFTIPATPTDMIVFTGSASKTVKILKIRMFMGETTAGNEKYFFVKRSTADSGGTSTNTTAVPVDSSNAAATAILKYYTVNPLSLGTLVGNLSEPTIQTPIGSSGSAIQPPWFELYDASTLGQPITLRGASESVALNFAGATLPSGLKVQWEVTWTEE